MVSREYLIGTGGWAYFRVSNQSQLRTYSRLFDFVEVNHTFYMYPNVRTVEKWRRVVPANFIFAVRCHRDLTHRIGLRPVDDAYTVLSQMRTYCDILQSPFLVLETPAGYVFDKPEVEAADSFFKSATLRNVRLVWEVRAQITSALANLMADHNIVHCIDLSRDTPSTSSKVLYTRLFGKGMHNIYQFTDEELVEIDQKALNTAAKTIVMSFHGLRMSTDAGRFKEYKESGAFLPVTAFTGIDSAKAVLSEDARFPISKQKLIEQQGWKVIDLTKDKRVHLSELLAKMPDKTFSNLEEVLVAFKVIQPSS